VTDAVVRPFWYGTGAPGGVQLDSMVMPVFAPGDNTSPSTGGTSAAEAFKWSITDTLTDVTPIPAPPLYDTTHYAFVKQLALEVVTPAVPATTLTNAAVRLSTGFVGNFQAGWQLFYRANPNYVDQSITPLAPPDFPGVDEFLQPVTPAGWQVVPGLESQRVHTDDVSLGIWDAMGTFGNGGSTGRVTQYLDLVIGVTTQARFWPVTFPVFAFLIFTYSELAQPGA